MKFLDNTVLLTFAIILCVSSINGNWTFCLTWPFNTCGDSGTGGNEGNGGNDGNGDNGGNTGS